MTAPTKPFERARSNRLFADAIDLEGNAQANFPYTGTAGQSSALEEGLYDIWSDQDCYVKVDVTANDVTSATGYLLLANNVITVIVRSASKIGAIRKVTSGTFSLHKVG